MNKSDKITNNNENDSNIRLPKEKDIERKFIPLTREEMNKPKQNEKQKEKDKEKDEEINPQKG